MSAAEVITVADVKAVSAADVVTAEDLTERLADITTKIPQVQAICLHSRVKKAKEEEENSDFRFPAIK